MRAIWGFPKLGKGTGILYDHPFGKDDDRVIVQAWLPQVEIIAHPAIACGLTHCGFGGTTEYIMAGIPMLCYPFFGDQIMNANLLVERGAALKLQNSDGQAEMDMSDPDHMLFKYS